MSLSLELICQAQHRLRGRIHRTPLLRSHSLSEELGANVFLKLECLQKTGSFKPRGAFNKLLTLTDRERARGVVAVSGGNHAQGVALAARTLDIAAVIVMPRSTPRNYVDATRGYGAEVLLTADIHAAFAEAQRLQEEGRVLVHPFNDPLVAAGQGTVGLEILEDLPSATRVYVSIGGGAFIGGIASALKAIKSEVRVFGVQTHGADAMAQSIAAGQLVELPAITSIARTLGAPKVCEFTLNVVRAHVEEIVVVEDAEAVASLFHLLMRTKYLTEPAASCCLSAAKRHHDQFTKDDNIVLVLCGGNISGEDLARFWQQFEAGRST